jgi:hypothetical protein
MFRMLLAVCLLAVIFPWTNAAAQDETPSPTPVPDEQQARPDLTLQKDQIPAQTQEQLPADDQSYDKAPINLATGQLLKVTSSPLRWGHFSVLSFNAVEVYDSNFLFRKDNPLSAQAGAVQGLIVYAIKTGRMNFSLQYRPQIWVSSESTQFDYASHLLDMHASRRISPQWSVNFSDRYQWAADRGNLDQIGLTSDYASNNTNQNPFLVGGRRLISNIADFSVAHNFTAHNSLEFSARHQYISLSALPIGSTVPDPVATENTQQIIGGQLGWSYQWSRNNSLGIHYAYDREFFQDFTSSAQFHSVLFGFSRRLTSTLVLQVNGGPTLMVPDKAPGAIQAPDIRQTYQGSAALFKTFHRAGFTLSYSRSNDFTGQVSDGLNDRFGATYSERFFRRLDLVVGGAYVRQNYLSGAHLLGKTGWTEIDYRLSPSWSFYTTYSYLTQGGGPTLYGPRHLVTSGIRWSWDAGRNEGFGR